MKDYYYILGIKKETNADDIKSAYRKLSKKFHPDVNNGDKFFEERFKEIQEAYETLSNIDKRKLYDESYKNYFSVKDENFPVNKSNNTEQKEEADFFYKEYQNENKKTNKGFEKAFKSKNAKNISEVKSSKSSNDRFGTIAIVLIYFLGVYLYASLVGKADSLTLTFILIFGIVAIIGAFLSTRS